MPVHQFAYLWYFMFAYVFRNLLFFFLKYSLTAARARRQYHNNNNKCYGITFENHFVSLLCQILFFIVQRIAQ